MSTWGQKSITCGNYYNSPTLYYEYNTTSDNYRFVYKYTDEYSGNGEEELDLIGEEKGEAMMEAFMHHLLAFKFSGDVEEFVSRYVENNRFGKIKK